MDDKSTSFFRFEDLRVYGKAVEYNKWLINALHTPRNEGERRLCDSFVSSSLDIALNIAEGSSRNKTQFDHFLKIAKSAIRECVLYTTIAHGLDLLTDEQKETSRELLMEQTRMIGALIISLTRGSRHSRDTSDESDYGEENAPSTESDTEMDKDFSFDL